MISDCLIHDATTVHAFVTSVILYYRIEFPFLKRLLDFSDGAASQYKNFTNLNNICHHHIDHGLDAEWQDTQLIQESIAIIFMSCFVTNITSSYHLHELSTSLFINK